MVALGGVTRGLEGPREVIGGLDALDHDGETQCSTEFGDGGDEAERAGAGDPAVASGTAARRSCSAPGASGTAG